MLVLVFVQESVLVLVLGPVSISVLMMVVRGGGGWGLTYGFVDVGKKGCAGDTSCF